MEFDVAFSEKSIDALLKWVGRRDALAVVPLKNGKEASYELTVP